MNAHELTSEIKFNSSYSEAIRIQKRVSTVFLVVLSSLIFGSLPLIAILLAGENLTQNSARPSQTNVWQVLGERT
ncbi:hypothetical protein [Oscillatoria salina]|uniref:hypothetical protein n=1 Tax=Oscillatoria salina TaxID=331517 RepID=UPI001CD0030D|nr:hypothetical protein [Oscillatoria salina]MBZ8179383.1 hypothetical protein [Oscillatoria salina IIICB1]